MAVGVLELMAGEDADDALVGADDALLAEQPRAGDAGGAGRLAAEAAGADLGLGVEDFLVGHLAHHAVALFQRPQALAQVHRPVDLDGAGDRRGLAAELVELGVSSRRRCAMSGWPPFQRRPRCSYSSIQRVGPGGVDHRQPRQRGRSGPAASARRTPCRRRCCCPGCRRARRSSRALPSAGPPARGT